jgi:hypothetical protein
MLRQKKNINGYFLKITILFAFAFIQTGNTTAQSDTILKKPYYFYQGVKYGSQGNFNPFSYLINSGYDIYQLTEHDRRIFQFPYAKSATNVFWNLGHPVKVIEQVGWWKFTRTEMLPLTFNPEGAQWIPNYLLHVIGGGMSYATLSEWYRFHNVKYPRVFGFATFMTASLINEIIENNGYNGSNSDPIPDIYFFNFAGVALFSSEKVQRFFSQKLHMADWSLQPSITFTDLALHNCGQYYSFKWEIPFERRLSLFSRLGMGTLVGASWKFKNGDAISAGAGVRSGERYLLDEIARQVSISTPFSFGIFYDRNNSLLASVQVSDVSDYFINANVYPGLIKIGKFSPGLWAVFDRKGYPTIGITTRYTLGTGLGYNFRKP